MTLLGLVPKCHFETIERALSFYIEREDIVSFCVLQICMFRSQVVLYCYLNWERVFSKLEKSVVPIIGAIDIIRPTR